jgi:DNA-binding NarL/FixJ family response regulator
VPGSLVPWPRPIATCQPELPYTGHGAGAAGPAVTASLPPRRPQQSQAQQRIQRLTDKEREVLAALADGLASADIAEQLHLSEATVKTHVSRILTKLNLTNRVQAAILAHHAGLTG